MWERYPPSLIQWKTYSNRTFSNFQPQNLEIDKVGAVQKSRPTDLTVLKLRYFRPGLADWQSVSAVLWMSNFPTDPFTILQLQNVTYDGSELHINYGSTDLEVLKLRERWSGEERAHKEKGTYSTKDQKCAPWPSLNLLLRCVHRKKISE